MLSFFLSSAKLGSLMGSLIGGLISCSSSLGSYRFSFLSILRICVRRRYLIKRPFGHYYLNTRRVYGTT
jgi:hypothetical protein